MGKPAGLKSDAKKGQAARWPFDPLQPGDHEPVRIPEEVKRAQNQKGGPRKGSAKR
jgi:hypothetical protein